MNNAYYWDLLIFHFIGQYWICTNWCWIFNCSGYFPLLLFVFLLDFSAIRCDL